jgi:hypothetical protein
MNGGIMEAAALYKPIFMTLIRHGAKISSSSSKIVFKFIIRNQSYQNRSKMSTLLEKIAQFLICTPNAVRYRMEKAAVRERVLKQFESQLLMTNYEDRSGNKKPINLAGITEKGAHQLRAHGNLGFPFNSKLTQYYMDRHNLKLRYPFHPCIIHRFNDTCIEYYPLELIQVLPPPSTVPSSEEVNEYAEIEDHDAKWAPKLWDTSSESSGDDSEDLFFTPRSDCVHGPPVDARVCFTWTPIGNKKWEKKAFWIKFT